MAFLLIAIKEYNKFAFIKTTEYTKNVSFYLDSNFKQSIAPLNAFEEFSGNLLFRTNKIKYVVYLSTHYG